MPSHFITLPHHRCGCENCGCRFQGGRYINHCPYCLFSKHVDKDIPGDRQSACQGLMEPIAAFFEKGIWRLQHKCTICHIIRVVDTTEGDNWDKLEELSHFPTHKA